jgi:hypothetical protein
MNAETWFSEQDAVDQGFADRVETGKQASNRWNLTAYRNAPQELLEPKPAVQPEPQSVVNHEHEHRARRLALLEKLAA